jgi:DNA-binding response OmpR family regulator
MRNEIPRVLVVERTTDADEQISDKLATAGYAARTVKATQSALDMLAEWQPDVLVVDLRVPNQEGKRFCASLAEHALDSSVPVVLLGELSNMTKAGPIIPFGLVSTPIDDVLLTAAVRRAVEQQGVPPTE